MNLEEMLGIDAESALDSRARRLIEADRKLMRDLVARRNELGLSQVEVARRMDTSQSVVARVESAARDMHQSTIRRYAMAVEALIEHRVEPDLRHVERSPRISDFQEGLPDSERNPWHAFFGDAEVSTSLWESGRRSRKASRKLTRG